MFPIHTKILLAEDTDITRRIVHKMLIRLGFQDLTVVSDGAKALSKLEEALDRGKPFDLVLADRKMPKMTGMELLQRIRRSREMGKTPVIMLTTINSKEHVMDAIAAGVTNYLAKPFSIDDLSKKLEETWEILSKKKK